MDGLIRWTLSLTFTLFVERVPSPESRLARAASGLESRPGPADGRACSFFQTGVSEIYRPER
jgi:hypothetical protein